MHLEYDTREFDKALKQYAQFTKRTMAEVLTTKLFFVLTYALYVCKRVPPEQIEQELRSIRKGSAPYGALIINRRRGRAGKKGLHGNKMQVALERLIKGGKKGSNFVRSVFVKPIRTLAMVVKDKKGGTPIDSSAKDKSKTVKGVAIPAKEVSQEEAESTFISFLKKGGEKTQKWIRSAVNAGLRKEAASMIEYAEKKMAAYKG